MADKPEGPNLAFDRGMWMLDKLSKTTSSFGEVRWSLGLLGSEIQGMMENGGVTLLYSAPNSSSASIDAELPYLLRQVPSSRERGAKAVQVGERAPDFNLTSTADGKQVRLANLRGQPFALRLTRAQASGII